MEICVFTGSSAGRRPEYAVAARALGAELAARHIGLVYGGATVGLMGAVADAVLGAGGRVTGVLPKGLAALEIAHQGLTELHIVDDMHSRKALMAERSDAFIVLPGGIGTLEEMFEVWTWSQLGIHAKPVGLLNVAGFFDPLVGFVDQLVSEQFVRPVHRRIMTCKHTASELIDALIMAEVPTAPKLDDLVIAQSG